MADNSTSKMSPFDKSVVLIGFMGVGKTTIGEVVAKKLGRTFVDIDREIEKAYNMPVSDIFESLGEDGFRNIERDVALRHLPEPRKVISLGGGAFLDEQIRHSCVANCVIFYLDISWDTWSEDRLKKIADSRPVLRGLDFDEVKKLFEGRKPIYALHHYACSLDHFDLEQASEFVVESVYHDMLGTIKRAQQ